MIHDYLNKYCVYLTLRIGEMIAHTKRTFKLLKTTQTMKLENGDYDYLTLIILICLWF